ncbi:MAG: DUF2934 domain-containing protein [Thermoplasmatota archaeon]
MMNRSKATPRNEIVFTPEISDDAIRVRAFQIYEERGRQPGDPRADWERAQKELLENSPPVPRAGR